MISFPLSWDRTVPLCFMSKVQKPSLATSVGIQPDAVSVCALTHITKFTCYQEKAFLHQQTGEIRSQCGNQRDPLMDIEVFLKINGFIGERGQVME